MLVLLLQQRTPEWHVWREGGIGSSDATILMGEAPDPEQPVSLDELLAEKLRLGRREETFAMRRGRSLESPALRLLEEREGLVLRPACVEHDGCTWLRASLDGLTFLGDLVAEIKAPRVVEHEIALGGVVPRCYWPQVQHQLLVTELPALLYVSYSVAKRFGGPDKPSLAVVEVAPDAEYQAALIAAEQAFWARLCRCRAAGKLVA